MLFPVVPSSARYQSAHEKLRRVSGASSPYEAAHDETASAPAPSSTRIVAIARVQPKPAHGYAQGFTPRSFSAQLLELGLKHNVDGLVRKAERLHAEQGAISTSDAQAHYERAQNNFTEEAAGLFRWQA